MFMAEGILLPAKSVETSLDAADTSVRATKAKALRKWKKVTGWLVSMAGG